MKVYVYVSAAHFKDECTDIIDVQVFTNKQDAINHLNQVYAERTSDEGGWTMFTKLPDFFQLTDGDYEYVAYVREREI